SNVSGLAIGSLICLDQLNDNLEVSVSGTEGCQNCGRQNNRSQQQWTEVRGVNGTTVSIWPPVYLANWRSSQQPEAWWMNGVCKKNGIEDLTFDGSAASPPEGYAANLYFRSAWNCWVKNV